MTQGNHPPICLIRHSLRRTEKLVCAVPRASLPPAGQWLRDNARALHGAAEGCRACGSAYLKGFCEALVRDTDARIDERALYQAVRARQKERAFTVDELRGMERALRQALIGYLYALLPAIRRQCRAYQAGEALSARMARGESAPAPKEALSLFHAMELLTEAGDARAARRLESALRETGGQLPALRRAAREESERLALSTGNTVTALLLLPRVDWGLFTERVSRACALLSRDAAFRRMDRESRALYLTGVARVSRRAGAEESKVCESALSLCRGKTGAAAQAGYYLTEDTAALMRALGKKDGLRAFFARHKTGAYLLSLVPGIALSLAAGAYLLPWYGVIPFAFAFSEAYRQALYRLLARVFPPRALPRLKMECLPKGTRALVTVPTLLLSEKQALQMCRQLSVLYLANADAPLDFLLLGDFADAPSETRVEDESILRAAESGIRALNAQYGARFFYLHRRRAFSPAQEACAGRERKRGALQSLNMLLCGETPPDAFARALLPPDGLNNAYAYVITLDADTFMPQGAAEKLLGAMAHPLQSGRVTVIQPKMLSLPLHVQTRAQALLGGFSGADGYGAKCSELYQDVFGRGSFMGKGIYEPRAFLKKTRDLPDGRILSHDLLEGELAGSAFASDIACYDGHPRAVSGFLKRAHRWTRGDWQLLPFALDKRLDALSRLKIIDNLRRSLVPAMRVLTLLIAAANGAYLPFALALLPAFSLSALARWPLLPALALTYLDAVARALWRLLISHKRLLAWITAAQAEQGEGDALRKYLPPILTGVLMLFLSAARAFWPGFLLGAAWCAYPLFTRFLDAPNRGQSALAGETRTFLLGAARDTFRFFEEQVNKGTRFLPPDNVQLSPPRGAAMRTSPTNIGLYLLSLCAAREMGFLDSDQMLRRMRDTLDSLEKLQTWHGNPYNWYDLNTLLPMLPKFVSAVDAGNYAVCLAAAAQAARGRVHEADASLRAVPARLDALHARMRLQKLYDRREMLFYVGYDASAARMSAGHYDLLASEARLLSYAAIMSGQVSEKHWWRLGRVWARAGGRRLLSWGGTMFEYLMPALLLPMPRGTLLSCACAGAVRAQKRAAVNRPMGVSESGFSRLDEQMNYAYRAFGLPELALSADARDTCVSPYAAALALKTDQRAAASALMEMKRRGWYGDYGFYEAADYAAENPPQIVYSHMAHHQGMLLCAICNALKNDYLVSMFMALPRARAHWPLLCETPPRRVRALPYPLRRHRDERPEQPFMKRAEKGLPVDAHLLSGGGTSWLLSADGQGYVGRGERMYTRFDPFCGAISGPQVYLREAGAADEPGEPGEPDGTGGTGARLFSGACTFLPGEARYALTQGDVRAQASACVDPLTGGAVLRARLRNMGSAEKTVELTIYIEPTLDTQRRDSAHQAFSSLFIRVTKAGDYALLATRSLREGGERRLLLNALSEALITDARFLSDRALFIGRGRSALDPQGLYLPDESWALSPSPDPCLCLRLRLPLPAGRETTVYFTLSEGEAPRDADEAARAFALSAARARFTARTLKLSPKMLSLCGHMAGQLFFTGQAHQAARHSEGVRALWRAGVSGDLAILLVTAQTEEARGALRAAAMLFSFLCENGAQAELIFLLPEDASYERPLRTLCEALVMAGALRGRARIVQSDDDALKNALFSLCRLHIDAQAGAFEAPGRYAQALCFHPGETRGRLPPLPRLMRFNGYGGFTREGGYVICPPAGQAAPAPWCLPLSAESFGTLAGDTGLLSSYHGNSRLRRVTYIGQDAVSPRPGEEYYLVENGRAFPISGGLCPGCGRRAIYDMGEAVYETAVNGLYVTLSCFTDPVYNCGARVLSVRNLTSESRAVALVCAARFYMGEDGAGTWTRAEGEIIYARCPSMAGEGFLYMAGGKAHTVSEGVFAPLSGGRCLLAEGEGTVGVVQSECALSPGQTDTRCALLGYCEDAADIPRVLDGMHPARERLRFTRGYWNERLKRLAFFLPDDMLSLYFSGFLPYQVRAARLMMRAGFYQSGGAWGFRDQLQDMLSLVYTEPERVRAHLVLCAARQYTQGDVQHWWHPGGAGVRTRISDDLLFLPYVAARYARVTGDAQVFACHAPYLTSPELGENERDRYETAAQTAETEPLMAHCLRAINRVRLGERGIPLMGGGDWNDGMDTVGGESAWLGFFFICVLHDFAPYCEESVRADLDERRRKLTLAMQSAWTGQWFLRAWYPDGRTLGAPDSDVARIDLISQCFACFAGMPKMQTAQALDEAWNALRDGEKGITRLLWPPFTPREGAGYIGAYQPGVRENGGQYTHAVPWFMRALIRAGHADRAWRLLQEILPFNHADTPERARVYAAEPFALPADVYATGRGGWTWYTGSAAWLYDVFLTDFLGFDKQSDTVRLTPRVPGDWAEFTLVYTYGESRYHLTASRDAPFITLDGERAENGAIRLIDDGRVHEARFPL